MTRSRLAGPSCSILPALTAFNPHLQGDYQVLFKLTPELIARLSDRLIALSVVTRGRAGSGALR
jgi:hypothetical protein